MEKTICYGTCPAYKLVIYSDGRMHLDGKQHLELIGEFGSQLKQAELGNLIAAFDKAKFFEFENQYTASYTDLPTTYISYTKDGDTKKIMDYYGAPAELKKLEKLVEELLESKKWRPVRNSD